MECLLWKVQHQLTFLLPTTLEWGPIISGFLLPPTLFHLLPAMWTSSVMALTCLFPFPPCVSLQEVFPLPPPPLRPRRSSMCRLPRCLPLCCLHHRPPPPPPSLRWRIEFFWYHTECQLRGSIPIQKNGEKREEKEEKRIKWLTV